MYPAPLLLHERNRGIHISSMYSHHTQKIMNKYYLFDEKNMINFAKKVLCVLFTSVYFEPIFSKASQMYDDRTIQLSPENVQQ